MNDAITLERLAAANPAPTHGLDIDDTALLAAIEERSVAMSTNTENTATKGIPPLTDPEPPSRRGWLIAVAAFAVVIAVGAVIVSLRSTNDVAPATPPAETSTTQATPTTQASAPSTTQAPETPSESASATTTEPQPELNNAAVGFVEDLIAELSTGDAEAAAQRILNADTFEVNTGNNVTQDRVQIASLYQVWANVESSFDVVDCRTLTNGLTRCEIHRTSPLDFSAASPEIVVTQVRLDEQGQLAYMRQEPGTGAWSAEYAAFSSWVQEQHPDVWTPIFFDYSDPDQTTQLLTDYYALWSQTQN